MKPTEEQRYIEAKRRVKEIKDFYFNLLVYILVIGFLAFLNYKDGFDAYPWFLWPAGGWGIGIAFKAANAFQWNPFFNKRWEERKINEYLEEDQSGETQRWE